MPNIGIKMKAFLVFVTLVACCVELSFSGITGRIVNGANAGSNQFPWVAYIQSRTSGTAYTVCSGALISSNFVLTAAHCVVPYSTFTISLGSITSVGTVIQTVTSANIVSHPQYNNVTLVHDIALVRLNSDVPLGPNIQTIRLPTRNDAVRNRFAQLQASVSGFGVIDDTTQALAPQLQYTNLTIIPHDSCLAVYGSAIVVDSKICGTGTPRTSSNACSGDSGGALVLREPDNIWTQIGIMSFVASTRCDAGYPSGYTGVAFYLSWISTQTGLVIRP